MKTRILTALLAVAVATPAIANDPPLGSRLGERLKKGEARNNYDALRTAHRLAECLYFKRGSDVIGALTALSPADQKRHQRALSQSVECRNATLVDSPRLEGVAIQAPADVLRGMMAEAVLEQTGKDELLQPLPAAAEAAYQRDWFAITGRDRTVDEMAVCTAEQNPAAIRDLLATKPESPEELAAVKAAGATLGPCLPQGATLKANRQSLRAALAEALFHRSVEPPLAATKG